MPVLKDPSDNYYIYDRNGDFGGSRGQVVEYMHDSADRTIAAYDVEGLLDGLVSLYESGPALDPDGGGILNVSTREWNLWMRRRIGSIPPVFRATDSPKWT